MIGVRPEWLRYLNAESKVTSVGRLGRTAIGSVSKARPRPSGLLIKRHEERGDGAREKLRPTGHAEMGINGLHVYMYRVRADGERLANLALRQSNEQAPQGLLLPCRETIGWQGVCSPFRLNSRQLSQ